MDLLYPVPPLAAVDPVRDQYLNLLVAAYTASKALIAATAWGHEGGDPKLVKSIEKSNSSLLTEMIERCSMIYPPAGELQLADFEQLSAISNLLIDELCNVKNSCHLKVLKETARFITLLGFHLHYPPLFEALAAISKKMEFYLFVETPTIELSVVDIAKALVARRKSCLALASSLTATTILDGVFWAAGQNYQLAQLAVQVLIGYVTGMENSFDVGSYIYFLRKTMELITTKIAATYSYAQLLASTLHLMENTSLFEGKTETRTQMRTFISNAFIRNNPDRTAHSVNLDSGLLLVYVIRQRTMLPEFVTLLRKLVGEEEDEEEDEDED